MPTDRMIYLPGNKLITVCEFCFVYMDKQEAGKQIANNYNDLMPLDHMIFRTGADERLSNFVENNMEKQQQHVVTDPCVRGTRYGLPTAFTSEQRWSHNRTFH
jgi:hypothetical protein